MDAIYPMFARADAVFYDEPTQRAAHHDDAPFDIAGIGDLASWERINDGVWVYWRAPGAVLPEQGWKIHLSGTAAHAEELLRISATYCFERRLIFKHLATRARFEQSNGKDAAREASGKFITIYPSDVGDHHSILRELGELTRGFDGPHILSDLRWHEGPVFTRYGGFKRLLLETEFGRVTAIRHPDGHLVEDVRRAAFDPPPWIDLPDYLATLWADARDLTPPDGFPEVTGVVQFSNAGGVYTAVDRGLEVVLKEFRPHAGLTADGRTAGERAEAEAQVLLALQAQGNSSLIRRFDAFGHRYLVLKRIDGTALQHAVASRHPLAHARVTQEHTEDYCAWADALCERLDTAVAELHAAGFSHGDLHPGNVLLDDHDELHLIDFEMARPLSEDAPVIMGAPGFVPSSGEAGAAADLFAVSRIKSFIYAPMAPLLDLHPAKASEVADWAQCRLRRRDTGGICDKGEAPHASRDVRIAALGRQLVVDATPTRADRLWPGDPAQFDEPPYALAHGALGPLLALSAAGVDVPEQLLSWAETSLDTAEARPGLYDGLAGAAVGFAALGRQDVSDRALERCLGLTPNWQAPGIYGGPVGVGLAMLRLSPHHPELRTHAESVFAELATRANGWRSTSAEPAATGATGLLRGPSGAALLALALFDHTARDEYLDLAENALRADLAKCLVATDGSLQVNEGWRLLPYLGAGTAGVGQVLLEFLKRRPTSEFAGHLEGLEAACTPEFVLESGLFQGRAGLLLTLASVDRGDRSSTHSSLAIGMHERFLDLHAIPRPDGEGFPGSGLLRLSCDLATGSAGVLWTLASLRDGTRLTLPFLDLPPAPPTPLRGLVPGGR